MNLAIVLSFLISSSQADPIGLKNFRQLLASYEMVTGISARTPSVQTVYKRVKTRLPISGRVDEMSSPMLLAATELAGTFCNELLTKEVAAPAFERRIFSQVDFTKGPVAISKVAKAKIIDDLAIAFWQRTATTDEIAQLSASLDEAAKGSAQSEQTQKVMQVMCTVVGTSLAFLTR